MNANSSFRILSFLLLVSGAAARQTVMPTSSPCASSIRDDGASGCLRASSVPTLGKLFPISSDFFIDGTTGNVAIGTIFAQFPFSAVSTVGPGNFTTARFDIVGTAGTALHAQSSDQGIGVDGRANGDFGTGVVGNVVDPALGGGGWRFASGVSGAVTLDLPPGMVGAGVSGWARNANSGDYGVLGQTDSTTTGIGVFGHHRDGAGTGAGVEGLTASTESFAVGVRGVVESTSPGGFSAGVRGENNGTGGLGIGVYGSQLGSGWGVYGVGGVAGRGVVGSSSSGGTGVYGSTTLSGGGFGVFSDGDFGGTGAKYFVQPHPENASQEIRYVCLEGNESGTYFRGSSRLVDGQAWIDVPEDFRLTTDTDGLTAQITPRGKALLWVEEVSLDGVLVRGEEDIAFDYFVNGVRRGFTDLQPVQANVSFVPRWRGVPFGAQLRPEVRQLLVENGTLNADFTPNEATAIAMGWALEDPVAVLHPQTSAALTADQAAMGAAPFVAPGAASVRTADPLFVDGADD